MRKKAKAAIEEDFTVTLGVTRTPGGMYAISVSQDGKIFGVALTKSEVSKCQLSDLVPYYNLSNSDNIRVVRFVWGIELLNGDILCWSVPTIIASCLGNADISKALSTLIEETIHRQPKIERPKGLGRPFYICEENIRNQNDRWVLGTLCEVGDTSDWALQSSAGCQFDIALGQVPQSDFGCVLRAGQHSQAFIRAQLRDIDSRIFSSNILEVDMYSQSQFLVTPPAFVISLYALFLDLAAVQMDRVSDDGRKNHLEVSSCRFIEINSYS